MDAKTHDQLWNWKCTSCGAEGFALVTNIASDLAISEAKLKQHRETSPGCDAPALVGDNKPI